MEISIFTMTKKRFPNDFRKHYLTVISFILNSKLILKFYQLKDIKIIKVSLM